MMQDCYYCRGKRQFVNNTCVGCGMSRGRQKTRIENVVVAQCPKCSSMKATKHGGVLMCTGCGATHRPKGPSSLPFLGGG